MGRSRFVRRASGGAAVLCAVGMVGYQLFIVATPASAVPADSTWSGLATTGTDWSLPANWSANPPGTGASIGTLTFPDLPSCDNGSAPAGSSCHQSNNNLTGVSVGTIDTTSPPSGGYRILGNALTVSGGFNATGNPTSGADFQTPLTLAGTSQSWSVASNLELDGVITGPATQVTATLSGSGSGGGNLTLSGNDQVASFAVVGHDTTMTGQFAGNNGFLNLSTPDSTVSLNGSNGNPVEATDVAVNGKGSVGDLSIKGGVLEISSPTTGGPAVLSTGRATFDSASIVSFEITQNSANPGTDYSQLTSSAIAGNSADTGAVDLGGAALSLVNVSGSGPSCTDPGPGASFALVRATSLTGQVSAGSGANSHPIPNGAVVNVGKCAGSGSYPVRIDYSSTTLTATVLEPTSTNLTAASSSPQIEQPDLLTATVTAASGTPQGTVTFVDKGNTTIPGCANVPLSGSAPFTATCNPSFDSSAAFGVGATFNPAASSDLAPSTGTTTITVQPIPGTARSFGATATGLATSATVSDPDNSVSATASGGHGTVVVSTYTSDPVAAPTFNSTAEFFDVRVFSGSTFTGLSITVSGVPSGASLYWYDPAQGWRTVGGAAGSTQSPLTVIINSTSSPNISQLGGTVFAVALPPGVGAGYHLFASDGGVFSFNAPFYGSMGATPLNQPVVGGATATDGKSYYLVAADGGVFTFGPGAHFYGSTGAITLNQPVVGIAVDPATGGYWLVAADGGVFSFNAPFFGSMATRPLNQPIVGIASAPDGQGYYLVAKDGGVFTFGNSARFLGSMGGTQLNQPVVGMAVDPATGGYWLVAADGGVFSFAAPYEGSTGAIRLNQPVVGMAFDPTTGGYWLVAADGGVFSFGAPFEGSTGGIRLNQPVVGMADG